MDGLPLHLETSIGSVPCLGEAGGDWVWQESVRPCEHEGTLFLAGPVIAVSSLHLCKQVGVCVLPACTCVSGRRKDWKSQASTRGLNFNIPGKRMANADWGTVSPRKAFSQPKERDSWGSLVKDQLSHGAKRMPGPWDKKNMHFNHECHS